MSNITAHPKESLSLLIKFGTRKNMKSLRDGTLYMKNLKYYNNLEKEKGIIGIGDEFDGKAILNNFNFKLYDKITGDLMLSGSGAQGTFDLHYENSPVFCLFNFDSRNYVKEELDGDTLKVYFQFTQEQIEKLEKDFGECALVIKNSDEFCNRIKDGMLLKSIRFCRDKVNYINSFSQNTLQHFQDFSKEDYRIAFWKDRDRFSYQQEYRFIAFDTEVDDHLEIPIKDLHDISELIETEQLINCEFVVDFPVRKIQG